VLIISVSANPMPQGSSMLQQYSQNIEIKNTIANLNGSEPIHNKQNTTLLIPPSIKQIMTLLLNQPLISLEKWVISL
jgi:hypothetical protein